MKLRTAATFLIVASAVWILADIFWMVQRLTRSWDFYKDNIFDLILSFIMLIVPVALLMVGIALAQKKTELTTEVQPLEAPLPGQPYSDPFSQQVMNPSVGEWMSWFLICLIPIVGLIMLIIWISDNNNPVRKNWATASLIWSAIMLVIYLFLYLALAGSIYRNF